MFLFAHLFLEWTLLSSEDLTNLIWLYLLICAQIFDFKVCSSYIYIVFETNIGNYNNLITWSYVYTVHFWWLRNDRNGWSDVHTHTHTHTPNFLLRHAVNFFWGGKTQFYIRFQNICFFFAFWWPIVTQFELLWF